MIKLCLKWKNDFFLKKALFSFLWLLILVTGLGNQCAAYECYNREYNIINGEKVKSDHHFKYFPSDPNEINLWCNKI